MNDLFAEKEKAKEKIFDALVEYAAACHVENIANEFQQEDDIYEQIPFPPELDRRIKKLINQYYRKEQAKSIWKDTKKIFPKVAAVFFTIFIIFTVGIISSEAFRIKILNFLIQAEKEYTSIDVGNRDSKNSKLDTSAIPSDWGEIYMPMYVPKGFKITNTETLSDVKIILYSNDNNQFIVFEQCDNEKSNIRIDTENAEVQQVKINNIEGLLVKKNGLITIVWHNNYSSFSLMSKINKEELLNMAESVK